MKMKIRNKEYDLGYILKSTSCIAAGTASGLIVYGIFLYLNIAILGWNLGLIFAPLIAGYVETILANSILDENLGAISAFILFIYTTFYSFILKNPTLGMNFITLGATIVILQAAFPTLINFIILVVIGEVLSTFIKKIKKLKDKSVEKIKNQQTIKWEGPSEERKIPEFNEFKSNQTLNNLDFFFVTSTDITPQKYEILRYFDSEVVLEKDMKLIHSEDEKNEKEMIRRIKESKDECLIKLAEKIKDEGGNGVLDLTMNYTFLGGDSIQVIAMGVGISVKY